MQGAGVVLDGGEALAADDDGARAVERLDRRAHRRLQLEHLPSCCSWLFISYVAFITSYIVM